MSEFLNIEEIEKINSKISEVNKWKSRIYKSEIHLSYLKNSLTPSNRHDKDFEVSIIEKEINMMYKELKKLLK